MVKCADFTERMLMDFIYGRMPDSERNRVEVHIAKCDACRELVGEVGFVLRALDAVEADFKSSIIVEFNDDGTASHYLFAVGRNTKDEPLYEFQSMGNGTAMGAAFVDNEEAEI